MVTYPDPRTVTASEVLRGLRGIVEREQLDHVGYIGRKIDTELAATGALCRGHRACAVGSTWLAAGIGPVQHQCYGITTFSLPGTHADHDERLAWLAEQGYGGLRAAYVALCDAAQEYIDDRGLHIHAAWHGSGALEGLFESEESLGNHLIEPQDMLVVIDRAEELVAP